MLTGVSAGDNSSSSKITTSWNWVLLVIVIECIRSMVMQGVGIVTTACTLDGGAVSATIATSIV